MYPTTSPPPTRSLVLISLFVGIAIGTTAGAFLFTDEAVSSTASTLDEEPNAHGFHSTDISSGYSADPQDREPLSSGTTDAGISPEAPLRLRPDPQEGAVNILTRRAVLAGQDPAIRGDTLESRVNHLNLYYEGFTDAILTTYSAESLRTFQPHFEALLCAGGTSDYEIASVLRSMHRVPDFASARAVDCALSRSEEDEILWWALDMHRLANMPNSSAIDHWRTHATDPRTLRRLEPDGSSQEDGEGSPGEGDFE